MILKKWEDLPENIKNEKTRIYYDELKKRKISLLLKRFFDIFFSIILLIVLLPIFIILAIVIKIDSKGPVFYKQPRITQYNRIFKILKFRTMIQDADKIGNLITLNEDSRITRVGNIIRKLRLDEFPQLINILKGDMSFVGTRPEVKKYVDKYTDEMKATLLMPAGVTSYASIKYKNENEILNKYMLKNRERMYANITTVEEMQDSSESMKNIKDIDDIYIEEVLPKKMKYNLEYIKKFSLINDFKICIDTVIGVLK